MTKFRLFCVRPLAVCVFLWLLLVAPVSAQVRLSWNNRIEAPADYNAVVFRGESVVLEAALTQYGIALPLDGTATLYYAVAGTTNYTASAASISGNKLIALWTPELDSGAARYTFFLSANMSGGRIYRANGSITMQASPGAYPPIIPQSGPTLVSVQAGVTAAGDTNTAQGIAIASLQTGQASLTGQVNAALAMSYAAGDQATLARSTANAAALTAGVVRATGNSLAATQAVHTATLAGLSIASTNTHRIATNAETIATAAFNRPSGTDTGTVTRIISGVLGTNFPRKLFAPNDAGGWLTVSNAILRVAEGEDSYKSWLFAVTIPNDIYSDPAWWIDGTGRLMVAKGTYYSEQTESGYLAMLPETEGLYTGHFDCGFFGYAVSNLTNSIAFSFRAKSSYGGSADPFFSTELSPQTNGTCYVVYPDSSPYPWMPYDGLVVQYLEFWDIPKTYNLPQLATTNQVNTRLPKLSLYDTNTATTVTAVLEMEYTNQYNRLFIKRK